MAPRVLDVGLLFVLLLALWLPRALSLDRFVTVDEHTWLTRSANFAAALVREEFAETYQSEHLGVTTMWMGAAALAYAEGGHESPLFFNGRIYEDGRLGPDFYVLSFLWRTTPVMLVGLAAALVALPLGLRQGKKRMPLLTLALFAAIFLAGLTFSSKKFDRYLLPVLPPLMLIAAAGWAALGRAANRRWHTRYGLPALLVAAIVVQAALMIGVSPYYLSYNNPLMGVTARAPQAMVIGWGEGLEEAAAYLNEKQNAQNLMVASWYGPVFSYFFAGETIYIDNVADMTPETVDWYLQADYAVLYVHQWQRRLPASLVDAFAGRTPEHTVTINGLEYARVYKLSASQ